MLQYSPGDHLAHRLDPRSKLVAQAGFAAVAYAYTTPRGLLAVTPLTIACLYAAGIRPVTALYELRYLLPILVAAPLVAGATIGSPWFRLSEASPAGLAAYRILLIVLVGAAYVRSTSVRESRAAIQSSIPGRAGRLLGVGVGLVFRLLPVLRQELLAMRTALRARLGHERSLRERIELITVGGLSRALDRADRLSLALQARCFSWNATLPRLQFTRNDYLLLLGSVFAFLVTFGF